MYASLKSRIRVTKPGRFLLALIAVAFLCKTFGCAAYQVGNQALFPPQIRSVHIPIIESESYRRFLGQQLTEAVVKQVELDTPLVIADAAYADSILRCRITQDRKFAKTLDRFGEPRVVSAGWGVEVDWVDRSGVPLLPRRNLRISDQIEFIPEGGQSLSTAQRELIQSIAQQIVGQMESRW